MNHTGVLHFTPSDYLSDYKTKRLDLTEHGAYCVLLWHMWHDSESQCDFPYDYRALGSIWGVCPEEAERLIESLMTSGVALFQERVNKRSRLLISKRLREQKCAADDYSRQQSNKGRISGAVRRANAVNRCSTDVQPVLNQNEPVLNPRYHVSRRPVSENPSLQGPTDCDVKSGESIDSSEDLTYTLEYAALKWGRALDADEKRSVKRWHGKFGGLATRGAIEDERSGSHRDPLAYIGKLLEKGPDRQRPTGKTA